MFFVVVHVLCDALKQSTNVKDVVLSQDVNQIKKNQIKKEFT